MDNKYVRKNRKNCLIEKGEHNFGFKEFHELCVYKYAIGMNMRKKEYREVCEHNQFNTYEEWECYIEKKYEKLDLSTCVEFKKYLVQKSRNKKTSNTATIMVVTSVFSAGLSLFLKEIVDLETGFPEVAMSAVNLVRYFLALGVYLLLVAFLAYKISQPYWKDNGDSSFYADYIEVIDRIIEKKLIENGNKE